MQQQQTNQAIPDNLLPSHTFQFLLGDLKTFRGQTRYIFFQCVLGLSVERAHQTSTGRCPGGILTRPKPPQPVSWNTHVAQSTASAPQSLLRSELLSWAYLSHPVEETQSTIITHTSWPQLRVGSLNTAGHCKPHYCWHSTNSHSTFPSFLHKSPWYLNSLPGGSPPLPNDWRYLESSSMKIKNRFEDKEQPWCCQTPIEKCTAWSPIKQCCSTVEITWIQNVTT